jgi:hypothetical protein
MATDRLSRGHPLIIVNGAEEPEMKELPRKPSKLKPSWLASATVTIIGGVWVAWRLWTLVTSTI